MEHMHAWFVSEAGSQPIDHVGVCLDQQDALEAVFEKELHLVALVGARLDHAASLNTVFAHHGGHIEWPVPRGD